MPFATPQDVAGRLGRELTEAETTQTPILLSDAELLIRSRVPDLDERVQAGTLAEPVVVMVEAYAVARVLRNPEGFRQEQDGDYMYTLDSRVASGRLAILDEEWRLLGVSAGAFTITPYLNPCPTVYVDPWRDPWGS